MDKQSLTYKTFKNISYGLIGYIWMFVFAIFISVSIDIFPTFILFGSPEPFSNFSSFLINSDVGGVET